MFLPRARQDKLLVEEIGSDLIVYDETCHHAHSLNQTAALVWRHCDGKTTVADMAAILNETLEVSVDERVISSAVHQLAKAKLLEEHSMKSLSASRLTRREMLGKMARVGAVAVLTPLVTSILVPTPLAHASGGSWTCHTQGRGQTCDGSCPPGQSCGGKLNASCICG